MSRHGIERLRLSLAKLAAVVVAVYVIFSKLPEHHAFFYETLEMVGAAMIIVATLGRIWCAIYIAGRKDQQLCSDGPYSISRNPLYVFSLIGGIGIALAAYSLTLAAVILVGFLVTYHFVIRSEEQRLAQIFPEDYPAYRDATPRFFPRFSRYWSRDSVQINPRVAFRMMVDASMFMWLFVGLEVLEYLKEQPGDGGIIPMWWRLP